MFKYRILTTAAKRTFRFCLTRNKADFPSGYPLTKKQKRSTVKSFGLGKDKSGADTFSQDKTHFEFQHATGDFSLAYNNKTILSGRLLEPDGIQFNTDDDKMLAGFGADPHFPLVSRRFRLSNLDTMLSSIRDASYSSFPFFIIKRKKKFVGVYVNVSFPIAVSIKNGVNLRVERNSEFVPLDVFVFHGDLPQIMQQYANVTGKPALPPAWSLGYHQSRWSYKSAARVLAVAERFRKEQIPCDAIHLDIHYMDGYRVFTWDPKKFAEPKKMIGKLDKLGIAAVAIIDPGVKKEAGYSVYDEGSAKGFYCTNAAGEEYTGKVWPGKTVFPDFTRKEVQKWWADCHEPLLTAGIKGIWNDMNDPVLKMKPSYQPFEEEISHTMGSHNEYRNLYANLEAEGTVGGFKKFTPKMRPWVLTRSAFSGIQKLAFLWTGDNFTSWSQLRENLGMVLNLGMSGMPFAGSDVGGFGSMRGLKGVLKPFRRKELFTRWVELGSLMPFFRGHTILLSSDQEPWAFGEQTLNLCRKHINRRYRLMPYLYTLAYRAHKKGEPLVRPLFYDEPATKITNEQFMFGPALLAAPVMYARAKTRTVKLPPGSWYEYETGAQYTGEQEFPVEPGYYPLFVKAGTILPTCRVQRNAAESLASALVLEIYPAKKMKGEVVLDDGLTTAALKGKVFKQKYRGELKDGELTLKIRTTRDKYQPPFKSIVIRLPRGYAMKGKNGMVEGIDVDLTDEDRSIALTEFELPLESSGATLSPQHNIAPPI